MSIGYLYVTTNNVNDHVYVGQSSTLDEDRVKTYLGSGDYLRDAIEKYGRDNFSKRNVAYFDDQTDLDYAELLLIAQYRAEGIPLYNGGVGGPRAQSGFTNAMLQRFGVMPRLTQEWLETIKAHPETVKDLLSQGHEVSHQDFYNELEQQLRITQDLARDCPRCGSLVGEVCRTKSGNPSRNHAGRRA